MSGRATLIDDASALVDRTYWLLTESHCKALLIAQVERVESMQKRLGRIVATAFPHGGTGARAGEAPRGFSKRWRAACEDAGVPERLLHDFRGTAVRNLERRGVSRSVAMKITGHKSIGATRS